MKVTETSSTFPSQPVLLIDDENYFLEAAAMMLEQDGITNTVTCMDSRDVDGMLRQQEFSVVIMDMTMPHISGDRLLTTISRDYPELPVVMLTAMDDVKLAVQCMKSGAFDYLVKPVDAATLCATTRRALKYWDLNNENRRLKNYLLTGQLEHPEVFSHIITSSPRMRSIFQYTEAAAATSMPILITGETGVGKELLAQSIHRLSKRTGNFVAVNIAGLDDTLFADTLFGHNKGAFSDAVEIRKGLIEQAAGGTLFLDEIGDLSAASQIKLLRLLQEGQYYKLGSDKLLATDARIVVATNTNLPEALDRGTFRKDLYYRLRSHHIHIPPLRERKEDIPGLLDHFLEEASLSLGKGIPSIPPELPTLLAAYHYPGNIRELQAMVFDAVTRHKKGVLSLKSFRDIIGGPEQTAAPVSNPGDVSWESFFDGRFPSLKEVQDSLIAEALRVADGNQTIAASMLGINRKTLNKKLTREKGDS